MAKPQISGAWVCTPSTGRRAWSGVIIECTQWEVALSARRALGPPSVVPLGPEPVLCLQKVKKENTACSEFIWYEVLPCWVRSQAAHRSPSGPPI